jgi:hypothetical protein
VRWTEGALNEGRLFSGLLGVAPHKGFRLTYLAAYTRCLALSVLSNFGGTRSISKLWPTG